MLALLLQTLCGVLFATVCAGRRVKLQEPGDSIKAMYPGLYETSYSGVMDRNRGVSYFARQRAFKFADHVPMPMTMHNGQKIVPCLGTKVGSTRWKTLLIHGMQDELPRPEHTFEGKGSSHFYYPQHNHLMQHLTGLAVREYRAVIKDPEAIRLMWVRNPYERLLSGFLDKSRPGMFLSGPHFGGPFERTPEGFHKFVSDQLRVLERAPSGAGLNKHFRPQALQCGLQEGFQYDFILKVDKMNEWYPDVVNLLGLEGHVRFGWRYGVTEEDGYSSCFFALTGMTCEETSKYLFSRKSRMMTSNSTAHDDDEEELRWQAAATSNHSTGAHDLMRAYYNNTDVIRKATRFIRVDLDTFGYPEMPTGNSVHSTRVSITLNSRRQKTVTRTIIRNSSPPS